MKFLFVDNFRGFEKTFFPIKDVNFLVGENSTGKTSILGLIKLLSSPHFWLILPDFDTAEVNFGHFKDIVSINSPDRSYFSVGLVKSEPRLKGNINIQAFLMTFVESEGLPRISKYTYTYGGKEVRVKFGNRIVKQKHLDIEQLDNEYEFIKKVFMPWIDTYHKDDRGYSTLSSQTIPIHPKTALLNVHALLQEIVDNKGERRYPRGVALPVFDHEMVWLAPIRTKPLRTYDAYKLEFSPEGDHTPYLIKKILGKKRDAGAFLKFVERIGKESGLFESVSIKSYGRSVTSPFELDVILNEKPLSIGNVGYGVSQSLPLIVELFARPKGSWFTIQQPEVHLHPRAQAVLGDMLFELASKQGKKFLVETHSDFVIDRFRLNYREKTSKKPNSQVLFFERGSKGNRVYQLELAENGELPDDQPKAYRNFFIREEMKLLRL